MLLQRMSNPILSVKNLDFYYEANQVLSNICFDIYDKDFIALIGPNGGGKTTLLKIIVGLLKPVNGTLTCLDKPGYVAQQPRTDVQFPISVLDVVLMDLLRKGLWYRVTKADKARALACLAKVGMAHMATAVLGQLSGGQRQRVFIARALMHDPKLLILDEPTTGIDQAAQKDFYELLRVLNQKMAILIVSHDLSCVAPLVQKIACLNKKLVYHDSKEVTKETLEETYQCPIELIAHGVPHRVLRSHDA